MNDAQDRNTKQRDRYRTDPEYRQRRIEQAREYRERNRKKINAENRLRYKHDPKRRLEIRLYDRKQRARLRAGHVPIPPPLFHTVEGNSERVLRTSEVLREVGCTWITLQGWHRSKLVPLPLQVEGRKLYTLHQVELLRQFYAVNCYDREARKAASEIIHKQW